MASFDWRQKVDLTTTRLCSGKGTSSTRRRTWYRRHHRKRANSSRNAPKKQFVKFSENCWRRWSLWYLQNGKIRTPSRTRRTRCRLSSRRRATASRRGVHLDGSCRRVREELKHWLHGGPRLPTKYFVDVRSTSRKDLVKIRVTSDANFKQENLLIRPALRC